MGDRVSVSFKQNVKMYNAKKQKEQDSMSLEGLPETELLYYSDDPKEFNANF